jgi:hypothetical protein
MRIGADRPIGAQCKLLEEILRVNRSLYNVIESIDRFNLKNYYISAGCISQTVWNYQRNYKIDYGINDIDVIFFDVDDLSEETEKETEHRINDFYAGIGCSIDVTNEARVHLWYHEKFGITIPPYISSESAVNSWIPATAVGVKYIDGIFTVYAPYGMNDMYSGTIRPNKALATKQHFDEKSLKWKSKWDDLKIINW